MDIMLGIGGLVVGLALGFVLGKMTSGKKGAAAESATEKNWWELRKTLTGTQLQILQFMEGRREAGIGALQEKFSFIPDRELYYRLEHIVLLGFLYRSMKDDEVTYKLNTDYSGRVEDDKTVMLPNE